MVCPICNNTSYDLIRKYRSNKPIFNNLNVVQCNVCEMVFTDPMPTEDVLREYNASYFMTAHGGIPQDIESQSFFSGIAGLRMKHVENYLYTNQLSVKNILEIGPGTGIFAKKWLNTNLDNKYYAVETDTSCYMSLEETGVIITKSKEVKKLGKEFDLVIMSHVLEHVPDPVGFLTSSTEFLKEDGVVFIEVPCNDWQHKPEDEPHLLFFHKKPMMQLMMSLGFKNIQLSYHGQTIENLIAGPPAKPTFMSKVYGKLIHKGLYWFAALFYRGDKTHLNIIEQSVLIPFKAHETSDKPAWWLRVMAQKG